MLYSCVGKAILLLLLGIKQESEKGGGQEGQIKEEERWRSVSLYQDQSYAVCDLGCTVGLLGYASLRH